MKNKSLVIIGVILLILAVGGVFVVMNKKTSPAGTSLIPQTQTGSQDTGIKSTLKDLLAKNIPQKCTFSDKNDDYDMSGTMYIAGSRSRGDFNSVFSGKVMTSYMITKDNTTYTWQEGATTGYMMKFDPEKTAREDSGTSGQDENSEDTGFSQDQAFDPDKEIDYKCSAWLPDNSLFNPPSNIKFTDLNAMLTPQVNQEVPGALQNPCAACEGLSGDVKTQCLTALKCN